MESLNEIMAKIDGIRMDIISIISGKNEDEFAVTCDKCEKLFNDIVALHPEGMDQAKKKEIVNILRSLKDICLQLINIKNSVFTIVKKDEPEDNIVQFPEHVDQKVYSLQMDNKRAA